MEPTAAAHRTADAAVALAFLLRKSGIHVDAVRFPAVPLHKARLRVQFNAGHSSQDMDGLINILRVHRDRVDTAYKPTRVLPDPKRSEPAGKIALGLQLED